jgi:peptidoglycan DL-endopeptidase CwlO
VTHHAVRVRRTLAATGILILTLLVTAGPAVAEPDTAQPEGGSTSLREQLDAAVRGYNDATALLETSKTRQVALTDETRATESEVHALTDEVKALAVTAYKSGRISGLTALLDSDSPNGLLQRAVTLESQARKDNQRLRQLTTAMTRLADQRAAIEREITTQQDQVAEMDRRKQAAEKALATEAAATSARPSTGTPPATNTQSAPPPAAAPVPRRADGTLGPQSCSVKDPTTSGCVTPRMLNALQQARSAGFSRFTSCYRPQQDGGEHPQGRACDFAASASGFGNLATGGDKAYGDRLAAYFIANANRLGVLYVIWFRQIWLPSSGWRAYSGGGSPSADHTNHVHLSVQ